MRNLSSRNWDPTQSKFSDFKRFALSPRLIIMQWVPVVDRLLIPMEDTVLNVKIQFVQIVKEVLWKLGSFHLSFRVLRDKDSKVKILVGPVMCDLGTPDILSFFSRNCILRPRNFTLKSA